MDGDEIQQTTRSRAGRQAQLTRLNGSASARTLGPGWAILSRDARLDPESDAILNQCPSLRLQAHATLPVTTIQQLARQWRKASHSPRHARPFTTRTSTRTRVHSHTIAASAARVIATANATTCRRSALVVEDSRPAEGSRPAFGTAAVKARRRAPPPPHPSPFSLIVSLSQLREIWRARC